MELIDYLNQNDRFAAGAGIRLTEIGDGFARAVMTVEEEHVNGAHVCQGGALFTLADSITFFRSALKGDVLTAEARQEDHHKLPFCEIRVTNQRGELVCLMTGSAYRRKVPLMQE